MKKSIAIQIMLIAITLSFVQCQKKNTSSDEISKIISIKGGQIEGTLEKSGILSFKGIPYAAPPVGNLRWRSPEPAQNWSGIKKCNIFGPSAMQQSPEPFYMWSPEFLIPKEPISEDCLYLNVWTAAKSTKEKRPVLVWIHGGGFVSGSGSVPIYDGESMAKKGIVFVNINYRLGIFGFFAHPELSKESPQKASGNYGLLDQIAALQWIKQNIAKFGGDPENITIAGQSAGSVAVVCLIASPLAKGLFQKAIAQSGAGLLSRTPSENRIALPTLQQAEKSGIQTAENINALSLSDLRNIPAEELQKKASYPSHTIIDGFVLPESLNAIFDKNEENNVTLLTGWNVDEGIVIGPFKKAFEYLQDIEKQYGTYAKELLKYYPAKDDKEAELSQLKLARDIVFGAQNYTLANIMSSQGKNVFVYRFTRKVPGTGEYAKFGAFHTGEVPYAYDNLRFVNRPWEPVDQQLATAMSAYWTNFITSGNPNNNGLSEWPLYKTDSKNIMELGNNTKTIILPDSASLNFLHDRLVVKQ